MPIKAKLKITVYVGIYALFNVMVLAASMRVFGQAWMNWLVAASLLLLTIVLLDAFHPKVSLFVRSLTAIPQQTGRHSVALTFDDGPVQPFTGQILDILDQFNAKATFFCIGENVHRNPELAREIVRRGHTIGNHSQTHHNLLLASNGTVSRELEQAQQTISRVCGSAPAYFRCPKGYKSPIVAMVLRRLRLSLVAYGYPIFDVENPPANELVERVLNRAVAGDIILMHDGFPAEEPGQRDSLVAALPQIIEGLLAKGLYPVSLDEALGTKP